MPGAASKLALLLAICRVCGGEFRIKDGHGAKGLLEEQGITPRVYASAMEQWNRRASKERWGLGFDDSVRSSVRCDLILSCSSPPFTMPS